MKSIFTAILFSFFLIPSFTQAQEVEYFDLGDYKWQNRVLLIFSPNTYNADYREQVEFLKNMNGGIKERDLKIFYALEQSSASVKGALLPDEAISELRSDFGVSSSEYTVLLIGKDGTEKLRTDAALPAEDLFSEIDSMPMRKLEMRDGGK